MSKNIITLPVGSIDRNPDFTFSDIDKDHAKTLLATLRRTGRLDPILVWLEQTPDGTPSGNRILLDGAHRMVAYNNLRKPRKIPVRYFRGTKGEAYEAAVSANTRAKKTLTSQERMNAAWRMVWDEDCDLSIARTAGAAGIGTTSVKKMRERAKVLRSRWESLPEEQREGCVLGITGQWWRDKQDRDDIAGGDYSVDLTDEAKKREAKNLAPELRKAAGNWPKRDWEVFAYTVGYAFPTHMRELAAFHLEGQDFEEILGEIRGETGAQRDGAIPMNEDELQDYANRIRAIWKEWEEGDF